MSDYRIEHVRRHLKAILIENERAFPRKRIVERELVQIAIRLTELVEELSKGKNK